MDLFAITPSYSLLLGLCLEEYLCLRKYNPEWSFYLSFKGKVEPFVPDLSDHEAAKIHPENLPDDIRWKKTGEGSESGISDSQPNVEYMKNSRGTFRQRTDIARHNLKWLTLFYLGESVGLSPAFRKLIDARKSVGTDINRTIEEYVRELEKQTGKSPCEASSDNPSDIEVRLTKLAEFNETSSLFQLGRHFGAVSASLILFHDLPKSPFLRMLQPALVKLYTADIVKSGSVGLSSIKSIIRVMRPEFERHSVLWKIAVRCDREGWMPRNEKELRDFIDELESQPVQELEYEEPEFRRHRFDSAWMLLWAAFGEVAGSLRDSDHAVNEIEYSLPIPRAFQIPKTASLDTIREIVQRAASDLSSPSDSPTLAKRTIATLVQCIEPLARRVWINRFKAMVPNRYGKTYPIGLAAVLREVLRDTDNDDSSEEFRFACILKTLYDSYRCKASHDLDAFTCTLDEAHFVLTAIRMLMVQSEKLKRTQTI